MSDKIARRDFLGSVALAGAAAAAGQNFIAGSAKAAAETANPIISSSASELAAAIRAKKLSSKEVVEAHLERINAVNPKLNAVVQFTAETARKEAAEADAALARGEIKGPLHGVPMTIKDTLETEGVICTGGTKGRANFVPKADATAVARLRAAGAIFLGKTNVPELAGAIESDNLVYGRTNNPYDLARTPGGSSGGEAAIVAACGSPLGLGTDAGGSIRIPAHFCGLAAIKPTSGRVPRTGQFPQPMGARAPVFHVSLIARRVEDLALALPIIAGPDFRDASIVGMPLLDPKAVTISGLEACLFRRRRRRQPDQGDRRRRARQRQGVGRCRRQGRGKAHPRRREGRHRLLRHEPRRWRRRHPRLSQEHRQRSDLAAVREGVDLFGRARNGDHHRGAGRLRALGPVPNSMLRFMEDYDAVLSPVAPYPALLHGTSFDEANRKGFGYSQMYNLTGWPSATVRIGTSPEGLPLNVQVAARPWREDVALALAAHLEKSFGGWKMPTAV